MRLLVLVVVVVSQPSLQADLVIRIPGQQASADTGYYRLDYRYAYCVTISCQE